MKYKTSFDKLTKLITASVTILFAVIIFGLLSNNMISSEPTSIITISILLLTYFGVLLFRPISYTLSKAELVIIRLINNIKIEINNIEKVELLDDTKLKGTIRIFGVGGLFGYWGKFHNSKIGTMNWYATRRNKMVLITTIDNKKIVLTPDEAELFVSELTAIISN